MDEFEYQLNIEEQRARAQDMLRSARKALLVVITPEGKMDMAYINITRIEHRGLAEFMGDLAPRFQEMHDEQED